MTIFSKPKLIGLAGTFASGKDTLAKFLSQERGYQHASTSDMVRQEALQRFGDSERPTCRAVAKLCREESGAGVFVQKALQAYPEAELLAISGLRSSGEAEAVKKAGGILVFVDADKNLRYDRMKSRQRDRETQLSSKEFEEQEAKEWDAGDKPSDFNLKKIKSMSDVLLENNQDLAIFLNQAQKELGL